ncbi:MAG: hypothetical protein WAV76_12035 [Bacteroidota bacterium]
MNAIVSAKTVKEKRVNFWASTDLINRANEAAKTLNNSLSEFTREALEERVKRIEREKIDAEVALACTKFYDLDNRTVKEWAQFETVIE